MVKYVLKSIKRGFFSMTTNSSKNRQNPDICKSFDPNFRFGLTLKTFFKQLETDVLRLNASLKWHFELYKDVLLNFCKDVGFLITRLF